MSDAEIRRLRAITHLLTDEIEKREARYAKAKPTSSFVITDGIAFIDFTYPCKYEKITMGSLDSVIIDINDTYDAQPPISLEEPVFFHMLPEHLKETIINCENLTYGYEYRRLPSDNDRIYALSILEGNFSWRFDCKIRPGEQDPVEFIFSPYGKKVSYETVIKPILQHAQQRGILEVAGSDPIAFFHLYMQKMKYKIRIEYHKHVGRGNSSFASHHAYTCRKLQTN